MRSLLVFVLLLSGCVAPEEESDPRIGWCPHWVEGPAPLLLEGTVAGPREILLQPPAGPNGTQMHLDGRPLDLYRMEWDVDGTVEVRAYDEEGRGAILRDHRQDVKQQVQAQARLVDEEALIDAVLNPLDEEAEPGDLRLGLDGNGTYALRVTFHYRVCGL